jgi:aminopeptidase-like protein
MDQIHPNELKEFIAEMFPICRSITGNGVRETLGMIGKRIPLQIHEVPTGTRVLDWEIPREWNIREAFIKDSAGNIVVDFRNLNLHVLNYSVPMRARMDLSALKPHLFSIPERPTLVPYRTSYYAENWGFCISHDQLTSLKEDEYEVIIDSELSQGSLTYGELLIRGESEQEVLISTHICHPSLCNDNLSGIAVCTALAADLLNQKHYYSYRFLFIPGTIGAITWLALNEHNLDNIRYGLVTSLLGLDSVFTYKRSRIGNARIDRIVEYILSKQVEKSHVINFIPYGYDERQFCSPGFNLPVGNLTRVPFGEYPEYHTSADNLDLISDKGLMDSLSVFQEVIRHIEADRMYLNRFPKGEPQLGKRGLYDNIGGLNDSKTVQLAFLWILNYSDGMHSLTDVAMLSGIDLSIIVKAAAMLLDKDLISPVPGQPA